MVLNENIIHILIKRYLKICRNYNNNNSLNHLYKSYYKFFKMLENKFSIAYN